MCSLHLSAMLIGLAVGFAMNLPLLIIILILVVIVVRQRGRLRLAWFHSSIGLPCQLTLGSVYEVHYVTRQREGDVKEGVTVFDKREVKIMGDVIRFLLSKYIEI